jgi:hypothetical protein
MKKKNMKSLKTARLKDEYFDKTEAAHVTLYMFDFEDKPERDGVYY